VTPSYHDEASGIVIYCGDCRTILPALDVPGAVLVTDPPYGRTFRSGWSGRFGDCAIEGDDDTSLRDFALAWVGDRPAIVFGSAAVPRPAEYRAVLVWDKGGHVGMGDLSFPWKPSHEEIYVFGHGFTGRRSGSVLHYHAIAGTVATTQGRHHPTEKPRSLMRALIAKCPPGTIVDPFMGSGTTILAARDLGRRAVGIEVDPAYVEAAIRRLQQSVLPLEVEAS
jgi:hypothetical protein